MKTCLFYNEEKDEMDDEGITTTYEFLDGEEYIKCIPAHLSSFAIGSNGTEIILMTMRKLILLLILILIHILVILILLNLLKK